MKTPFVQHRNQLRASQSLQTHLVQVDSTIWARRACIVLILDLYVTGRDQVIGVPVYHLFAELRQDIDIVDALRQRWQIERIGRILQNLHG